MTENTRVAPQGSDWTRLLTDPDFVSHLGTLLQTYREVPAQEREAALIRAMREIKKTALKARETRITAETEPGPNHTDPHQATHSENSHSPQTPAAAYFQANNFQRPVPVDEAPPFEADLFAPLVESGRRHFQRIKCYVAVEIRVEDEARPVWGTLVNIGRGGCLVETASAVPAGKALEIGLWVSSGKLWVKGVILSGVATRSARSCSVRVKFSQSELSGKEHLREFLKFVENTVRKSHNEQAYVAQLKR